MYAFKLNRLAAIFLMATTLATSKSLASTLPNIKQNQNQTLNTIKNLVCSSKLASKSCPTPAASVAISSGLQTPGTLLSSTLSYTYTSAQLETDYDSMFCSKGNATSCAQNITNIATMPGFGGFNLNQQPIINNGNGVTSVAVERVSYTSPSPLGGGPVALSGTVFLPQGLAKTQLKGTLLYFHPTIFNPAAFTQDANCSSCNNVVLAALYASQGYIVVMPDYNGMGIDAANVHPYIIYPRINTQSGLYLLSAIRSFLQQQYGYSNSETIPLFNAGFSEGGAYSMWFSYLAQNDGEFTKLLNNNHYQLKASVAMDGAYAISVTLDYLMQDVSTENGNHFKIESQGLVNMLKPVFAVNTIIGFAYMSGASDYSQFFNTDFYNMRCNGGIPQALCKVNGVEQLTLQTILRDTNAIINDDQLVLPIIMSALNKQQNQHTYLNGLSSLNSATNNSGLALMNANLFVNSNLNKQFSAATITTWQTNVPLEILSLNYDSVVTPLNFDAAVAGITPAKLVTAYKIDNSKIIVNSKLGDKAQNLDHMEASIYLNIAAVAFFNSIK